MPFDVSFFSTKVKNTKPNFPTGVDSTKYKPPAMIVTNLSNDWEDSNGSNEHGNILFREIHHKPKVDREARIL